MTTLELDGISAGYGRVHVLHDLTVSVSHGDGVVVVMGANGAGKTTLCKTVVGLVPPAAGEIRLDGAPLPSRPRGVVNSGVVLVPEGRQVFASMTVEENLAMGAYLRRDHGVRTDVDAVVDRFPILGERRHQPAGVLSGGEQQLLAIARALMARPKVLMLDEPTHGLSPVMVEAVVSIIRELHAEGVAIVWIEQNAQIAREAADRAILMANGRLVADGSAAELLTTEALASAYLGDLDTTRVSAGPGSPDESPNPRGDAE